MSRQDQASIRLSINGADWGVWDKFSGGAIDSNETKYRPGGMAEEVSLGGLKVLENITVSRLWRHDRDMTQLDDLIRFVGKADVTVSKFPMDTDGNIINRPLVFRGKLKRVTPPPADSESTDAALVELEISTAGTVTA